MRCQPSLLGVRGLLGALPLRRAFAMEHPFCPREVSPRGLLPLVFRGLVEYNLVIVSGNVVKVVHAKRRLVGGLPRGDYSTDVVPAIHTFSFADTFLGSRLDACCRHERATASSRLSFLFSCRASTVRIKMAYCSAFSLYIHACRVFCVYTGHFASSAINAIC